MPLADTRRKPDVRASTIRMNELKKLEFDEESRKGLQVS
jgi:hypothetical protein